MNNYNYYTPVDLATQLLQLIPQEAEVTSIADICCGTWNLLKAASVCYPKALIVGVDTDVASERLSIDNAKFYAIDGREYAYKMKQKGVRYDLVLSNPPFGRLTAEQTTFENNKDAFFSVRRYETELLYANYELVKDDGYLLIILPITYVWGMQYLQHRLWIAANFHVLSIITLPPKTFGHKPLNTVALLLKKTQAPQKHTTQTLSANQINGIWTITSDSVVSPSDIVSGSWFCSYQNLVSELQVYRGNISSHYFSEDGMPVLHCSSIINNGMWTPSMRKCKGIGTSHQKYAERGDILINRIGKHAAFWRVFTGERCLISDCLIVVKQPDESVIQKFQKFSEGGALQVPKLGVSTPYISAKSIISFISKI